MDFMISGRKCVGFAAAFTIFLAPLMACALPGVEMTPAEQSCCREMSADCSSMQMSDSHPCCKRSLQAGSDSLPAKSRDLSPGQVPAPVISVLLAMPLTPACFDTQRDPLIKVKSPPGRHTILRI
jgi:hypothetical protein